jgi:uncharacterized membrane protein
MIKALLIIGVVIAFLIGGLLGLRRSTRMGMPNAEVLERARKRTIEQDAQDRKESDK